MSIRGLMLYFMCTKEIGNITESEVLVMNPKIKAYVKTLNANELVEAIVYNATHFNPIDYDRCDLYEELKAEAVRRMADQ